MSKTSNKKKIQTLFAFVEDARKARKLGQSPAAEDKIAKWVKSAAAKEKFYYKRPKSGARPSRSRTH